MARRRQQKGSKQAGEGQAPKAEELDHKPLAGLASLKEQLGKEAKTSRGAKVEAAMRRAASASPAASPASPAPRPAERPPLRPRGPVEMSAAELFASAVDGLTPADVERGKFAGKGPDTSHIRVKEERTLAPAEIAALAKPDDPFHDEIAYFEEIMGEGFVRPMTNHLFVKEPGASQQDLAERSHRQVAPAEAPSREAQLAELDRVGGPQLTPLQRQLLRDVRKAGERGDTLPMVNVRGLEREAAVSAVREVALATSLSGRPYMRVITGKGLQSEERPVLKRAVLDWALTLGEHVVLAWAPEVEADGSFGALIFQVRRQKRGRG